MSEIDPGIGNPPRRTAAEAFEGPWPAGERAEERLRRRRLGMAAAFEREMEAGRGFLWLPVLLGAGILVYFVLAAEPSLAAIWAATALLAAAAWCLRRHIAAVRTLACLTAIAAGIALMTLRTDMVAAPVLPREMTAELAGWVAEREAAARGGARLKIAVAAIEGLDRERMPRFVRVTVRSGADAIGVGDALAMLARLRPPSGPVMPGGYDFGLGDFYDGIGAVGFAYGAARPADIGPPPFGIAIRAPLADLRETIRRRVVAVLPGDRGEIAAALIMGDQRGISDATQEAMRASGLGHVLSISGLHMALVAGSAFWLLRALLALSPTLALTRPIKKWAAAGALGIATFYLTISGGNVATQRAYVMLAVILCAVLLDRRAITVRNVAIAALVVLALEPESLLSASFQMSFAATLALVAGYEALRERAERSADLGGWGAGVAGWAWRSAKGLFLTSVLAGIATAPFAIYHFQRAAPLSLLANLAAMPVIGAVVMPAALFSVILMPLGLEAIALVPMGWGIDWMVAVGGVTADWSEGWGGIPAAPATALLLVVAGFLWICLWRERWRLAGPEPPLRAVPIARASPRPDILVDPDGRTAAVRGGDGRYRIVNLAAGRFAASYWLRADADMRDLRDGAVVEGIACDDLGCVTALPDGGLLALGTAAAAFEDDCRRAAIVVSRFRAPSWCVGPVLVIDRTDLARGGAHALYLREGGVDGAVAFRIETARPPGARRPFAPGGQ